MSYGFNVVRDGNGHPHISDYYGDLPADGRISVSGHEDATYGVSVSVTRHDDRDRAVLMASAFKSSPPEAVAIHAVLPEPEPAPIVALVAA